MLRQAFFLFAAFCLIPALAVAEKSSPNGTEKDLQGTWQAVDAEGNGGKLDEDKIKETKIVIESNTLGIKPDGEGRKTTFTVDSSKTPGIINLIPLDGDRKGSDRAWDLLGAGRATQDLHQHLGQRPDSTAH